MDGKIAVLIDAELHNELVLRMRSTSDVTHIIENVIKTFLDQTAHEGLLWSEEYIREVEEIEASGQVSKYGDPKKGYHWQILFFPNGTRLKINYKGRESKAEIRHQKLCFGDSEYSPSEWARHVANNTNRNAWRDIWVQFPGTSEWKLADVLRQTARERKS